MPEVVFDASCELVASQLTPYTVPPPPDSRIPKREPHMVCAIYAPDASEGKVALVRSWDAITNEYADEALRPPQATFHPDEAIGETYLHKVADDLSLSADALRRVYGLNTTGYHSLPARDRANAAYTACSVVLWPASLNSLPTSARAN